MNKNILLYKRLRSVVDKFQSDEYELDERILKLDRWNVIYGRSQDDVTMTSFTGDINRAIHMASLVVYKGDWDDPSASLVVLKFRYPSKELDNYLELLKEFPIFEPNNNKKEYDWIRNFT